MQLAFADILDDPPEAPFLAEETYVKSQLITYIGNKRALLDLIDAAFCQAKDRLGINRPRMLDLFSGSGVVSRLMKRHASLVWANDIEEYAQVAARCFLTNRRSYSEDDLNEVRSGVAQACLDQPNAGFISELYAPADESSIIHSDRVFYTKRNALTIDTASPIIAGLKEPFRTLLLGPFLSQCSKHVNTSGVFKGFYKNKEGVGQFGGTMENALARILKPIQIEIPVLSNYDADSIVTDLDAERLVADMDEVDIAYLDPPYNQHPYGSNYFMLNLICNYERPSDISRVSGIPTDWNRSPFYKTRLALDALMNCVKGVKAKQVVLSYSSEGFIPYEELAYELLDCGDVMVLDREHPTFRGCRNLVNRDTSVTEYVFLIDKR